MTGETMHRDEVTVDEALVRRLLATQFPEWADLPLEAVEPRGTDNWLYRLGGELVARLPCRERTVATLARERTWLPRLALLPFEIPLPVAVGKPGAGYPWTWSVYRWLEGENAVDAPVADLARAAADLAALLEALQRVNPDGGPGPGEENFFRGAPLEVFDPRVRADLAQLRGDIDLEAATAVWNEALCAPDPEGPPVWVHGDLDRRNLLTRQGRLAAVVDFGCLGVGDPACDVAVAWKVLSPETRDIFRSALSVDESTWTRARGWVVSQALGAVAYYTPETNPSLVAEARRWLADAL
jgi:aminoglycoside phosphotransferase (APT) family kinase protein